MLHDDQGHQAMVRTLSSLFEHLFLSTMYAGATSQVQNCNKCKISKDSFIEPKAIQGSWVANNPLDLVCLDFNKVDPSQDGKENILVITDIFSKFAVCHSNTKSEGQTVEKVLIGKWFYTYGISSQIHSDKGWSFESNVIHHFIYYSEKCPTWWQPYWHALNMF